MVFAVKGGASPRFKDQEATTVDKPNAVNQLAELAQRCRSESERRTVGIRCLKTTTTGTAPTLLTVTIRAPQKSPTKSPTKSNKNKLAKIAEEE